MKLEKVKKFYLRLVNHKEISDLQDELKSLEFSLSSMKNKLSHSRSTAEFWEEEVKTRLGTESQKKASVAYYWDEVKKDEAKISEMENRISEIQEKLLYFGIDI